MQAFILSAGLGTRLLPITNHIAKPLLPIARDLPLLKFIISNLRNNGFSDFVINCHHKSEQLSDFMERHYSGDGNIRLVYEKEILNTAGGLVNASEFIKEENFLLHNGDIFARPPVKRFLDFHHGKNGIAALLLVKRGKRNITPVEINREGLVMSIGTVCRKGYRRRGKGDFFYTGIQFLNKKVFDWLPQANRESLTELLFYRWLKEDVPFYGFPYSGIWSDIGTPADYLRLNFLLNKTRGVLDYSEKSVILDGVRLEKVILLQDTRIEANLRNRIVISPRISEPVPPGIVI